MGKGTATPTSAVSTGRTWRPEPYPRDAGSSRTGSPPTRAIRSFSPDGAGTGKSSLILDLIHSLATGEPFCGMEVLRGSKTMYLSCEDSEEELTRRIHQRSLDHSRVPNDVIKVWPRSGKDNILCFADKNGMLKERPPSWRNSKKGAGNSSEMTAES